MPSIPQNPAQASLVFRSEASTVAFARKLAVELVPGDALLLGGEIGAGKSVLARAVIQTLLARSGPVEDVPSPTFTLVQTYQAGQVEVWHSDLYRLGDASEVEELGLVEAFETAVCLVEWPDRLGDMAPDSALKIHLSMTERPGERTARLSWTDPRWPKRLASALEVADA